MMHFLLFAIQKRDRAHAKELQHAQHEKSCLIMIEERTKHLNICLHFRPGAVAANYFFDLILASKHYSRVSSFPSQRYTFVPPLPKPKLNVRISSIGDCCKMPSLLLLNCGTC